MISATPAASWNAPAGRPVRRMIAAAILSFYAALAPAGETPAHPNVLLILTDDLGWADVGYHGGAAKTPSIDKLAADGTRLERFYVFPVCSPTRAGILTGRSPMRLGIAYNVVRPWNPSGLPAGEHLISQSFKEAGYQTAMMGKWHLGLSRKEFLPNARGFDHFYGHLTGAIDYWTHDREGGIDWQRDGVTVKEEGYSTDLLAAEAVRWIKGRDKEKPFFLYLPFNAVHAPYQAPDAYVAKYAGIREKQARTHAAQIEAYDAAVGRVLDALREEGIDGNTVVFWTSDNGGPGGAGNNTPLRGAKASTFEGGIRVPAILRWPEKIAAGKTSDQVLSLLDVFPTLAAAAGVPIAAERPLDGKDFWGTLAAGKAVPRADDLFFSIHHGKNARRAVIRGDWKLVTDGDERFLFDLEKDPSEGTDLAKEHPGVVKDLLARLAAWEALHPADKDVPDNSDKPVQGWKAPDDWSKIAR